jgi:restriction endonuclease Mrr
MKMGVLAFISKISNEGVLFQLAEKPRFGKERIIPLSDWVRIREDKFVTAISKVLAWADDDDVLENQDGLLVPHNHIAELDTYMADFIGLPPLAPFILDVHGQGGLTDDGFLFRCKWIEPTGQTAIGVKRKGVFIYQGSRSFRLPGPIFMLVETLEKFNSESREGSSERLKAWARIQDLLQIDNVQGLKAEKYLLKTRIAHASAFSLSLKTEGKEFDFDPILFGRGITRALEHNDEGMSDEELVAEGHSLLPPKQQHFFAEYRFSRSSDERGSYALKDNWYVVLDEPVRKALNIVRKAKMADPGTRREFVKNPRAFIRNALGDDADAELLTSVFIETSEYSQRVRDVGIWETPIVPWVQREGDKWLPEKFGLKIDEKTIFLTEREIPELRGVVHNAVSVTKPTIEWKGESLPASEAVLSALDVLAGAIKPDQILQKDKEKEEDTETSGPVILLIDDNLQQVDVELHLKQRTGGGETTEPVNIISQLKSHQSEGLLWLQKAWKSGQGGVLLADDMGLGKTLLSLSFLLWLRQGMGAGTIKTSPILIVAPTGLLRNWEQEHDLHLHAPGLGECLKIYGSNLKNLKRTRGNEVEIGRSSLDVNEIRHASWVLTTYETLRDYQHSFASIRFAAIVFDEIQKTKTPGTIMTNAAKAMNGDFLIGLTGTPIENRLADLWCIIDMLEPGYLGDLKTFSQTYEKDENSEALRQLKSLLSDPRKDAQPVMLRRMKGDSLEGLPDKSVHVKTQTMPRVQRDAYSDAIITAQQNRGPGKMLEALHRLKSISLHPYHPNQAEYPAYISESARFDLLFGILDDIHKAGEKVLIFVESLDIHQPLAGFIHHRYGLSKYPLIISGKVTGPKRQQRVNEFQESEGGFDAMILSPRAGGVGLTLTAANHVIHLSRWWNPAVEDQCTDRIYRIGQKKPIHIYYIQALHPDFDDCSFDERIHALLERKRSLSRDMLMPPVDAKRDAENLYSEIVETELGQPGFSDQLQAPFEGQCDFTLDDVDVMEPIQFEDWCLGRLKAAGYKINKTPKSWDCGADGIAENAATGKVIIIQCKHIQTGSSCGENAIEELLLAKQAYDRSEAELHVLTNAKSFTPSAQARADKESVKLIAREELLNWHLSV